MSKNQKSRKTKQTKTSQPMMNSLESESSTAASMSSATLGTSPSRISYSQTFNPDYSNVIKDLKRIGTLAGIFFVVLIVLSFFLS